MRVPGLLVAAATGVVLTAGIIVATTAGASTAPGAATPEQTAAPAYAGPFPAGDPFAGDGPFGAEDFPFPTAPAADPTGDDPTGDDPTGDDPTSHGQPSPAADAAPTTKPASPTKAASPTKPPATARPTGDRPVGGRPGADAGLRDDRNMQQEALRLVNDARRQNGCPTLSINNRLVEAARGHAVDMAEHGYFAHRSPSGKGAGDRVTAAGYDWDTYGENIARGQDSTAEVIDGWLHSPEHRHNILTCEHTEVGVGLAFDADHKPYWVQDLASPDRP